MRMTLWYGGGSEVHTAAVALLLGVAGMPHLSWTRHLPVGGHGPCRQCPAHLFELGASSYLLGVDRGLDPVEQPLQPPDELRLGDPELRLRRCLRAEWKRQPLQLLDELGRQSAFELLDRGLIDV